mmetsp:Transcript_2243/g.3241  ORF Transcript_2243/g.3241 Transcript_2243/m.3241 type:complete len:250 (-) Transcript_2243:237-986(-)
MSDTALSIYVNQKDIFSHFQKDWTSAKDANDPNAPFCTLATVLQQRTHTNDDSNDISSITIPRTRTVTLREVDAEKGSIVLYINKESPKYAQLQQSTDDVGGSCGGAFEILTFWTSPAMIQYRLSGTSWSTLDQDTMKDRWRFKPKTSQLLDYYYIHHQAQSSVLNRSGGGREGFVKTMTNLTEEFANKDVPFQPVATGLILHVTEIEEWRGSVTNRLHERYLYKRKTTLESCKEKEDSPKWQKQVLVP